MAGDYRAEDGAAIIASHGARPERLVQILNDFVARYSYVSKEAVRQIADELNLSRADVHGVVNYYHDFRTAAAGDTIVKICQAEACQASGCRELTAHAEAALGIGLNETDADGRVTLEPVYCLGNCACGPSIMVDGRVYGRVDKDEFDALLARTLAP